MKSVSKVLSLDEKINAIQRLSNNTNYFSLGIIENGLTDLL